MAVAMQPGSSTADLKKLLAHTKDEAVSCAVAIGKDKKPIVLLHKTKTPRALLKELEQQAGGPLQNACFGTAQAPDGEEAGHVVFTLNKVPSGITAAMRIALKGTGYAKAVIRTEDGAIADPEEDAVEAPAAVGASPPPPPPPGQPGGGDPVDANPPVPPPIPPPPGAPPPPPAAHDPQLLTKELAALVRRIPEAAADPATKAKLAKLATDANVQIKTNNLSYAAGFVDQLRDALREALDAAGVSLGHVVAPAPAAPRAAMPIDSAALMQELTALVRRIPEASAADPSNKAALAKLATDAGAQAKAGDLPAAASLVAQLRDALRDALDASGVTVGRVVDPPATPAPQQPAESEESAGRKASLRDALAGIAKTLDAYKRYVTPGSDISKTLAQIDKLLDLSNLQPLRHDAALEDIQAVPGKLKELFDEEFAQATKVLKDNLATAKARVSVVVDTDTKTELNNRMKPVERSYQSVISKQGVERFDFDDADAVGGDLADIAMDASAATAKKSKGDAFDRNDPGTWSIQPLTMAAKIKNSVEALANDQDLIDSIRKCIRAGQHNTSVTTGVGYHRHVTAGSQGIAFGYRHAGGNSRDVTPEIYDFAPTRNGNKYMWMIDAPSSGPPRF